MHCLSSSNKKAKWAVTCSKEHFTHPGKLQFILRRGCQFLWPFTIQLFSWETHQSGGVSHNLACSDALGRNFDLFGMMYSYLQHPPLAKKPNCGSPSSAGDPVEAIIPHRFRHILYFSLWQRQKWDKVAWNFFALSWEMPQKVRYLHSIRLFLHTNKIFFWFSINPST